MSRILKATHGSADHPLRIGDIEIPCYVLEGGTRVITQGGFTGALNLARGGSMIAGMNRLELFVSRKSINPFIENHIAERIGKPIPFMTPEGVRALGFEATLLADLCEAVLKAREAGALQPQQLGIAAKCEILMRGFARVGIVALVDEATGYQRDRARLALEEILDKFISEELRKWAKTFPDEFYKEMFRLKGWPYTPWSVKRPGVVGHYTNDWIYARLAPGVLDELRRLNPKLPSGSRKWRHPQWLTEDVGHPRLREHLAAVIALMRASSTYDQFQRSLQRAFPKINTTLELGLDEPEPVH